MRPVRIIYPYPHLFLTTYPTSHTLYLRLSEEMPYRQVGNKSRFSALNFKMFSVNKRSFHCEGVELVPV